MRAFLFLSATLWTFLVLPSLCEVGEVVHARDCEKAADCTHSWEHESDPCGVSATAPKSFAQTVACNLALALLPSAPLRDFTSAALDNPNAQTPTDTDDLPGRPIADSDVPLLI